MEKAKKQTKNWRLFLAASWFLLHITLLVWFASKTFGNASVIIALSYFGICVAILVSEIFLVWVAYAIYIRKFYYYKEL